MYQGIGYRRRYLFGALGACEERLKPLGIVEDELEWLGILFG